MAQFHWENPLLGPTYNSTQDQELKDQIEMGAFLLKQVTKRRKEAARAMGMPSPPRKRLTKRQIEAADMDKTMKMRARNFAETNALVASGAPNGYPNLPYHTYPSGVAAGFPPGQEGMRPIIFDPRPMGEPIVTSDANLTDKQRYDRQRKAELAQAKTDEQFARLHRRQLEAEARPKTRAQRARQAKRDSRAARQAVARDSKAGIGPGILDALKQQAIQTEIMQEKNRRFQQPPEPAAPFLQEQAPGDGMQAGPSGIAAALASAGHPSEFMQLDPSMAPSFQGLPYQAPQQAPAMPASSQAIIGQMAGIDPAVQVAAMNAQQQQNAIEAAQNQLGSKLGAMASGGGLPGAMGMVARPSIAAGIPQQPIDPTEAAKQFDAREKVYAKIVNNAVKMYVNNPNDANLAKEILQTVPVEILQSIIAKKRASINPLSLPGTIKEAEAISELAGDRVGAGKFNPGPSLFSNPAAAFRRLTPIGAAGSRLLQGQQQPQQQPQMFNGPNLPGA